MRILLVCPDVPGVDAIAEVRQLQSWHDIAVLHGTVTVGDVYRALQEKTYDSVYFASHGGPQGIQLSNNNIMSAEDIAQACRQKEVKGIFLTAWKLAAAFYGQQRNGHAKDFVGAYLLADSGDGEYALHISPLWVQDIQRTAVMSAAAPHNAMPLTQAELIRWGLFFIAASVALSTLLARLAGG